MKTIELSASVRTDLGKKATKAIRRAEMVPCELYGAGENIHFSLIEKDLNKLLYTPEVYIVKLNIDGKEMTAVLREVQYHPTTDRALHADFFQVCEEKPFEVNIPVKVEGFAKGVQAGGKLALSMRKLKVKGLMKDLPEFLTINVTELGLGKSVQIRELAYDNLELLNAKNAVVVQVKLTRAARAAAQQAAAAN
ncbi:MAG: 50S ribosomal protein L25/general stress protein Ctc [Marinifilaceae bacterium]|jgi:large subunit ribosomal protein L25|nr:50S ribosomal protein L25/general stress protein Ctc [Marinifilaceae bacterium]